jgi:DNA-binding response OmpR family regulator
MPIRILIVDDAAFIRDMMKKHLRSHIRGSEIFDAVDGNRAVAALKANNIDLIMSDWEMPDMTGEELLHWVRQDEKYKECPFVMVSSRGDRDHIVKAIEAGVSDYLTKPFTPEELVKKAAKQLKKIGKDIDVKFGSAAGKNQGHAFGSIEALTGKNENDAKTNSKATKAKPEGLLSKNKAAPKPKPKPSNHDNHKSNNKPKAQLRFPGGTCECEVKELSLQALVGIIKRTDTIPTVFEQAVVDIATQSDQDLARINAFVHSVQANGNNVSTDTLKVTVRFVDDDPAKLETLSKFIARK